MKSSRSSTDAVGSGGLRCDRGPDISNVSFVLIILKVCRRSRYHNLEGRGQAAAGRQYMCIICKVRRGKETEHADMRIHAQHACTCRILCVENKRGARDGVGVAKEALAQSSHLLCATPRQQQLSRHAR